MEVETKLAKQAAALALRVGIAATFNIGVDSVARFAGWTIQCYRLTWGLRPRLYAFASFAGLLMKHHERSISRTTLPRRRDLYASLLQATRGARVCSSQRRRFLSHAR